jgi:hypothetical protein
LHSVYEILAAGTRIFQLTHCSAWLINISAFAAAVCFAALAGGAQRKATQQKAAIAATMVTKSTRGRLSSRRRNRLHLGEMASGRT